MSDDITRHDKMIHFWCPQLGQTMPFSYCRRAQGGFPCAKVMDCFTPHFDVETFLRENYPLEQRQRFLGPQPGRLDRIAQALTGTAKPDSDKT